MLIDTEFGRIALTVCYDLVFPEYIRSLVLRGARLILNRDLVIYRVPGFFQDLLPLSDCELRMANGELRMANGGPLRGRRRRNNR